MLGWLRNSGLKKYSKSSKIAFHGIFLSVYSGAFFPSFV